jgi:hypothetical protein
MSIGYAYNSARAYQAAIGYNGTGLLVPRPTVPLSFSDKLGRPNGANVLLATFTVSEALGRAQAATGPSGNCWRWPTMLPRVDALVFDGGEITFIQTFDPSTVTYEGVYYFDPAGYIYIYRSGTGLSQDAYVWSRTWKARALLRFASRPKTLRGVDWSPRLAKVPSLALRIESKFSGVGQLGGGRIELTNADGWFDGLDRAIWDGFNCVLELGVDLPGTGGEMPESEYRTVGTWRVESVETSEMAVGLSVKELKTRLDDKIPVEVFTWTDYPNMPEQTRHKVIPRAYGRILGAAAYCVDATARRFKIANHGVRSFDGVRIDIEGVWTESAFASADRALGEFTLGSDWENGRAVSVDFSGRTNADGTLMVNGADIVGDLLDYFGETELDQESFTRSAAILRVGYNRFGQEVCEFEPSLYLDKETNGIEVLSILNETLNAALYTDLAGHWRFVVFEPRRRSDLATQPGIVACTFTAADIETDTFKISVDDRELFADVRVNFAARAAEDWSGRVKLELPATRTLHGMPRIASAIRTPALSSEAQATAWGQRLLRMEAQPRTRYAFTLARSGYFLTPSDKIRLTLERFGMDHVLEVLEVRQDLTGNSCSIVAGDLRSWTDTFGFWVEDTAPAWSAAWTDAETRAARQNSGFWTAQYVGNETHSADPADSRSYLCSRWL